jgi:hypothetical protein
VGDDLNHGKDSAGRRSPSILAFTSSTLVVTGGILGGQCTAEYKVNFAEKVIHCSTWR